MKENGLGLIVVLYNSILAMCADLGHVDKAVEIFELNNIYIVLFIKKRIIFLIYPIYIYILFVFRLRLSIHNIQII